MKRFTKSLRSAVANGDWYVALATALTLPDLCGRLVDPALPSGKRYPEWFRVWMEPHYTRLLPRIGLHTFLTGDDCYALRCSYLHEGGGDIVQQRARKVLDDFHFIYPLGNNNRVHLNRMGNTLQLQVDIFCIEMADAVDAWSASVDDDSAIQARMKNMLVIHGHVPGLEFL